jgi:uncharacterized FlgJ-related protein
MARKSKGFGRLLHQARQEKSGQDNLKDLEKKLASGPLGQQLSEIILNPQGEVKISAVLEDFVEPYRATLQSDQGYESLLSIAVMAWNIALLGEDQQSQQVDWIVAEATQSQGAQIQQDIRSILEELITRKKQHFASINRHIVDFQLKGRGDTLHLSVAATLSPK